MRSRLSRRLLIGSYAAALLAAGLVLFHFAPEQHSFYPRCALHALTGVQCPGCGGLRATHHLLHGEWRDAWRLNPLVFMLLPILGGLLADHMYQLITRRPCPHPFHHPAWLWSVVAGCVFFGLARNLGAG